MGLAGGPCNGACKHARLRGWPPLLRSNRPPTVAAEVGAGVMTELDLDARPGTLAVAKQFAVRDA